MKRTDVTAKNVNVKTNKLITGTSFPLFLLTERSVKGHGKQIVKQIGELSEKNIGNRRRKIG